MTLHETAIKVAQSIKDNPHTVPARAGLELLAEQFLIGAAGVSDTPTPLGLSLPGSKLRAFIELVLAHEDLIVTTMEEGQKLAARVNAFLDKLERKEQDDGR